MGFQSVFDFSWWGHTFQTIHCATLMPLLSKQMALMNGACTSNIYYFISMSLHIYILFNIKRQSELFDCDRTDIWKLTRHELDWKRLKGCHRWTSVLNLLDGVHILCPYFCHVECWMMLAAFCLWPSIRWTVGTAAQANASDPVSDLWLTVFLCTVMPVWAPTKCSP